jgi:hypothetical protein
VDWFEGFLAVATKATFSFTGEGSCETLEASALELYL